MDIIKTRQLSYVVIETECDSEDALMQLSTRLRTIGIQPGWDRNRTNGRWSFYFTVDEESPKAREVEDFLAVARK